MPTRITSCAITLPTVMSTLTLSRKSKYISTEMAENNFGPMDPTSSEGLQDQVDRGALPDYATNHSRKVTEAFQLMWEEVQGLLAKQAVVVCEDQFVSCLLLEQKTEDPHHFEDLEKHLLQPALLESQGCIPFCLHCQRTLQVPLIHMKWPDLQVNLDSPVPLNF